MSGRRDRRLAAGVLQRLSLAACVAGAVLAAGPAHAQAGSASTDVPDHYRIEMGGFRIGSNTSLRLNNGTGGGTEINFENELSLPDTSTRFYVEGYWRIARRHQVSVGFFHVDREGPGRTLGRDVVWGDRVFTRNTQVKGATSSDYFSGVYRFAAFRNDRFEVGPALGFGHLALEATLSALSATSGANAATSVGFERTQSLGQVTGDLGGYLSWWPAKRLLVRGDLRYIIVKPEKSEASIADGRTSLTYHPWPKVGIGLQYTYTKFRYIRDILSTELGGNLRYHGLQLLAGVAF